MLVVLESRVRNINFIVSTEKNRVIVSRGVKSQFQFELICLTHIITFIVEKMLAHLVE